MRYSVQATYVCNGTWLEKGTFEYYQAALDFANQLKAYGTYEVVRIVEQ